MLHKRKVIAALTAATTIGMIGLMPITAMASSHREAPLISQDPAADNTDLYAYVDQNKPGFLNIIANYIGLEKPAGGPLFSNFADDVEYRININNTGTASDDIVYKFRFHTTIQQPLAIPLPIYNAGPITKPNDGTQLFQQTYSVERDDASGQTIVASNVPVAPANPGPRSFPSVANPTQAQEQAAYEAVANQAIRPLGLGSVFAGPRKDAFFADLGSIFDLVALRPIQSGHEINQPPSTPTGIDGLIGMNVHEIALQLPFSAVLAPGSTGIDPAHGSIVGIYASSARQRVKVLDIAGGAPRDAGRWVQVSRLGLPLVNEVLIPLQDKDRWNGTDPADDGAAGFLGDILDSGLVRVLPTLYPGLTVPSGGAVSRPDLVALATGQLAGAPMTGPGSQAPADLLRVNLATLGVTGTPGNRLGVLQGDTAGFPNGRRLTDDVVDIELRVLAGGDPLLPAFNHAPNNALSDGVDSSADRNTRVTFPYLGPPIPGYFQP